MDNLRLCRPAHAHASQADPLPASLVYAQYRDRSTPWDARHARCPLGEFDAYVKRYRALWEEHQGVRALTLQGTEPKIGLIMHMLLAETDAEAEAEAKRAWAAYRWNLGRPAVLKPKSAASRSSSATNMGRRPTAAPTREVRRDLFASIVRSEEQELRRMNPGGISSLVVAGSPASMRAYLDEYMETGANILLLLPMGRPHPCAGHAVHRAFYRRGHATLRIGFGMAIVPYCKLQ